MSVTFRAVEPADLPACLALAPTKTGQTNTGYDTALKVWTEVFQNPFTLSVLAETTPSSGAAQILGFGAACFVPADFIQAEIENPAPGLNDRFIERYLSGRKTLLNRFDIGIANAGSGINVIEVFGDLDLSLSRDLELEILMGFAHIRAKYFAGYRVNTAIFEVAGRIGLDYVRAAGYPIIQFPDAGKAFCYVNREALMQSPGSVALASFHYSPPVLGLKPHEQDLLEAALRGATDEELSAQLGIPVPTLKARWRSLLARAEQVKPEWNPAQERNKTVRGPQRRHRILAYCREHPEELRPYHNGVSPRS